MSETESTPDDTEYAPDRELNYLDCEWVPHDAIEPNDWNPNEMPEEEMERLKHSIEDNGWTMPIVVHAEEMYIIDGEQRWHAATEISDPDLTPPDVPENFVPVYGITVDEEQAKLATVQHNRARGDVHVDALQDYLKELDERGVLNSVHDRIGYDEDDARDILGEIGAPDLPDETMPWEEDDDEDEEVTEDPIPDLHNDRTIALRGDVSESVLKDAETHTVTCTQSEYEILCRALGDEMRAQSLINLVSYVIDHEAVDDVVAADASLDE
jgi:hypothetical protein